MVDPTVDYRLICFPDLAATRYSSRRIPRSRLRRRVLFARTNRGNYAKLEVRAGATLRIPRLTVYSPDGCIVRMATNLRVRSSFSCDLDRAVESSDGADFWWHAVSSREHWLEPQNRAAFHQCPDFDDVGFEELRRAPYRRRRIAREALASQLIYCRTNRGGYAKLLLEAGDTLIVRRLETFDSAGRRRLLRSNLRVPRTFTLDLDTGELATRGRDLWWRVTRSGAFELTPRNGAAFSYESYYRFEKYEPLLRRRSLGRKMVWQDGAGARAWPDWSVGEQGHLREFLYLRETGRELPIQGPPPLTGGRYMKDCDAWKIYLAHVAQSLWADAGRRVAWRLSSANAEHLEHLFDMRRLMAYRRGFGHSFEFGVMGAVTHWDPELSWELLNHQGLLAGDPWTTIRRLVDWCRAKLTHIAGYQYDTNGGPFSSQAAQWQHIYGYPGLPLVDKMIHPLPGRFHTTHGCWGTDGFLAAVLRTVNIPLRHGRSVFSSGSHSRAELFTVGRNLAHGDDPYNGWVRLGHNNVPIADVFMTDAELASRIDSPRLTRHRTVPDAASHNHTRHLVRLGVRHKTDYLLRMRCRDRSARRRLHSSEVWAALNEFYSDSEIRTIIADCDAAIGAVPGGCPAI